jgi:hypothetical protein
MSQQEVMPLEKLLVVARNQRGIMLCILAQFGIAIVGFALGLPPIVRALLSLVVGLASTAFTVMLARAVYDVVGVVLCVTFLLAPIVGSFVVPEQASVLPLVSLLTLFVVNQRATKELKAAGFEVGLLGGDPADVERRMSGR